MADLWALTFKSGELDDGGGTGVGGDGTHTDRYVTGENIDGKDVVLWYRVGFRHDGPADCADLRTPLRPVFFDPRTLTIDDVTVAEGNAGAVDANFTFRLSAASSNTVTVNYATADVTATAGSDYVAKAGSFDLSTGHDVPASQRGGQRRHASSATFVAEMNRTRASRMCEATAPSEATACRRGWRPTTPS